MWFGHGLMLLWFKDLMNVTEKLKFMDPTFRPSCLVSSVSGKVGVKLKNNFQCQKLISITDFFNSFKRYNTNERWSNFVRFTGKCEARTVNVNRYGSIRKYPHKFAKRILLHLNAHVFPATVGPFFVLPPMVING